MSSRGRSPTPAEMNHYYDPAAAAAYAQAAAMAAGGGAAAAAANEEEAHQEEGQEEEEEEEDEQVVDSHGVKRSNTLPFWGNANNMNLNPLIFTNITSSPYFKVNLVTFKTYHQIVDEIYYKVDHLEPWERGSRKTSGQTGMCGGVRGVGAGGIVSSAFCLLFKLYTLKLTRKQLMGLLNHCDSPYIRGLGFMYIRFTQPPPDLWDWFAEYLDDEEEIDVKAGGGKATTIGEMLIAFLTKLEWFDTRFPRIPVNVQKQINEGLASRNQERAADTYQSSTGKGSRDYDLEGEEGSRSNPLDRVPRSDRDRSSRDRSDRGEKRHDRRRSRSRSREDRRDRDRGSSHRSSKKQRDRDSSRDRDRGSRSSRRSSRSRSRDRGGGGSERSGKRDRRRSRSRSRDRGHQRSDRDRRDRDGDYADELKRYSEHRKKHKKHRSRSRSRSPGRRR